MMLYSFINSFFMIYSNFMSNFHSNPSNFVRKSIAFHILANQQNVVGWQLVLNYM